MKKFLVLVIIFSVLNFSAASSSSEENGDPCTPEIMELGNCTVLNTINKPCVIPTKRIISLPKPGVCGQGYMNQSDLDREGEYVTKIDQFPWTALLKYRNVLDNSTSFLCGGVLIHDRYVVTAAHCVAGFTKTWTLIGVRLGEWDLNTELDCDQSSYPPDCADRVAEYGIMERTLHEEFSQNSLYQFADIAMLRLNESVKYGRFIAPICLPQPRDIMEINLIKPTKKPSTEKKSKFDSSEEEDDDDNFFIAGWGDTEQGHKSHIKRAIRVEGVDLRACRKLISRMLKWDQAGNEYHQPMIRYDQMCAIGKDAAGDNVRTCQADPGGPLMKLSKGKNGDSYWYLAGVVSYRPRHCGKHGIPSIYTNAISFFEWIKANIKPVIARDYSRKVFCWLAG